ncbi:MAG TPA: hypothetical protein VFA45_21425 [Actinomycetes bacterium]|jgi:hypothetical protein|nr:hypothetical protein [Actinomycetes bacterium]
MRPPNVSILDGTFAVSDAHGDIQADGDQMLACSGGTVERRGSTWRS